MSAELLYLLMEPFVSGGHSHGAHALPAILTAAFTADHRGILVSIHTPEWKQYQPKAGAMTTLARNEGHVYSTKFLDVAASGTPGLGEEKWWQISIMFAKLEPVAAGAGGSGSFGAK